MLYTGYNHESFSDAHGSGVLCRLCGKHLTSGWPPDGSAEEAAGHVKHQCAEMDKYEEAEGVK